MKKRIVVKNTSPQEPNERSGVQDRNTRLSSELRDNLKKRKAQARAKSEASKHGQN